MTMAKKLSIVEIRNKLALNSVGTIKVLENRMSELSFDELRTLMISYNCTLNDLIDKIWSVDCLGKTRNAKVIR